MKKRIQYAATLLAVVSMVGLADATVIFETQFDGDAGVNLSGAHSVDTGQYFSNGLDAYSSLDGNGHLNLTDMTVDEKRAFGLLNASDTVTAGTSATTIRQTVMISDFSFNTAGFNGRFMFSLADGGAADDYPDDIFMGIRVNKNTGNLDLVSSGHGPNSSGSRQTILTGPLNGTLTMGSGDALNWDYLGIRMDIDVAADTYSLFYSTADDVWTEAVSGINAGLADGDQGSSVFQEIDRVYFKNRDPFAANSTMQLDSYTVEVIPEPATLGLVAMVGGAMLVIRRRLVM